MASHPRGKKRTADDEEVQLLDDRAEGSAEAASAAEVSRHRENGGRGSCSESSVGEVKSEKDLSPDRTTGEESLAPAAEAQHTPLLPIPCPCGPDIPLTVPSSSETEDNETSVWGSAGFPRNNRPIILPTLAHTPGDDRLENIESSSAASDVTTTEEDSLENEEEEVEEEESETEFMIRFLEL